MRWLVTGAAGQLGGHTLELLHRHPGAEEQIRGLVRGPGAATRDLFALDLSDGALLQAVLDSYRPTHVLHLAGMASPKDVAACPDLARRLNVEVTHILVEHARRTGAWLCYPSSDWVFDGSGDTALDEDARTAPQTAYGRLKVEAEQAVLTLDSGAVVRMPLLCGFPVRRTTRSTWADLRDALHRGELVRGVQDEYRTPLSFQDAARVLLRLAQTAHVGLLHAAGPHVMTPHEVVLALAQAVRRPGHVVPVQRAAFDAQRPRMVALDASRLRRLLPDLALSAVDASTFSAARLDEQRGVFA
jgi:dTDP-4-dehydrorhamnose reductase